MIPILKYKVFEKVQRDKKGDQYIIENAKVYEGIDIKIDFTNDDNTSAEQTKTAKYTLKGSKPICIINTHCH